MIATEPTVETWQGCYDESWKDLISSGSFTHPAKASRALLVRIFDELFSMGACHAGDLMCDPFAGVGTTGIEACSRGLRFIGVELEGKFVILSRENFLLHAHVWKAMHCPQPVIVQGDSRRLRQVLAEADCVVSSPPWASTRICDLPHDGAIGPQYRLGNSGKDASQHSDGHRHVGFGESAGQLGQMREGDIAAVISSPPYAEIAAGAGGLNTKAAQHPGQQSGRSPSSASQDTDQRYGETEGQLAQMAKGDVDSIVGSPPYPQPYTGGGGINERGYGPDGADKVGSRTYQGRGRDRAEGNLESLASGAVDLVVSSPPYEGSLTQGNQINDYDYTRYGGGGQLAHSQRYGASDGQLGQQKGDTFWTAAAQIIRECHAILKPGGCAVWILKAFIRDGKIQDFPGDWRRLCEHVGFETVKTVHAMLVAEERAPDLWGGERITTRARKSFFRRLYESKYPENRIDYEVVLFTRKPA